MLPWVFAELTQVGTVALSKDRNLRIGFFHQCGQEVEMVAEDDIRLEFFHRLMDALAESRKQLTGHFFAHIAVTGAFVRHFVAHAANRKRHLVACIIHWINGNTLRQMNGILFDGAADHSLLMAGFFKSFDQFGQEYAAAGAVRLLGAYA